MKSLFLLLAVALASATSAQTSKTFDVTDFTGVSVNSGIDATIEYGATHSVVVTANADVMDDLKVEVDGRTLKLNIDGGSSWWGWLSGGGAKGQVTAVITTPQLERVTSNGGADVASAHNWTAEKFTAVSNGGADLSLSVTAEEVEATSNGGADLTLVVNAKRVEASSNGGADLIISGTADHAELSANGGADVSARKLMCRTVDASANGAGDVAVSVSESIKARANGGSDIDYYGDPAQVDAKSNGGSDVKRG